MMKALFYLRATLVFAQLACVLTFMVTPLKFGLVRFIVIFALLHISGQYVAQFQNKLKQRQQEHS